MTGRTPDQPVCRHYFRIFILLVLLMLCVSAAAAEQKSPDFKTRLSHWQAQLERAESALKSGFPQGDTGTVEDQLKQVIGQAKKAEGKAEKQLQAVNAQLKKLGKPPGKGEPPEGPEIAQLRKQLERGNAQARTHATRADLVISRANDLLGAIADWKQAQVRAQILRHDPPPVSLPVWHKAAADALAFTESVLTSPIAWWRARQHQAHQHFGLLWLLLLPVIGLMVGWPIRRFVLARFGRDPLESEPSYARRIIASFADGLTNAIIPVAIIALGGAVLAWQGVLTGLFAYMIFAIAAGIAAFMIVYGLARAALSPQLVQWRIVPVEPAYARKLLRAVGTVVALLAAATVLLATAWTSRHLTAALESAFFLVQSLITALALFWLLTPKYWAPSIAASQRLGTEEEHAEALEEGQAAGEPERAPVSRSYWVRLVGMLRWLVLLTPFLALAGYGRLAFHLQSRLVATGAVVGVGLLLRLALHEMLEHVITGHRRKHPKRLRRSGDDQDTGARIMVYWACLGSDVLVFVPLVYLLLLAYGVPTTTLELWTRHLLAGITIGNITISLSGILVALVVLVLGVLATNLLRRWTANRLLPNTRLDSGARDSIAAGTSYVGVGIAILLAIASLGINFSNLALIAGALSLGIGFGLQNVVQNFAAGILLLIERPIKVGDWIIVGTTEGTVKRISVRSTEIETFNRSTVFVPNSDLISSQVTNWTHSNRMARLILPVRAAHGSDPREVEEVLLRCARSQRHVLRYPESYVWFRGFAEGVLNFELRVYMDNTDNWVTVDSGLYFAIEEAFQEAGIVIPFPQRELHVHAGSRLDPRSRLETAARVDDREQSRQRRASIRPTGPPGGESST